MTTHRPCINCDTPTTNTRCPTCARHHEQQRGTRQQRGYDTTHDQDPGPHWHNATTCDNCHTPFTPDNPKTRGHSTPIRHGGKGSPILPHCRRCNSGWRRTGL